VQKKRRLDEVCCEIAPEYSRKVIQSFILAGKVYVDDKKVTKAGQQVTASTDCKRALILLAGRAPIVVAAFSNVLPVLHAPKLQGGYTQAGAQGYHVWKHVHVTV
jgi:hypothetical protein